MATVNLIKLSFKCLFTSKFRSLNSGWMTVLDPFEEICNLTIQMLAMRKLESKAWSTVWRKLTLIEILRILVSVPQLALSFILIVSVSAISDRKLHNRWCTVHWPLSIVHCPLSSGHCTLSMFYNLPCTTVLYCVNYTVQYCSQLLLYFTTAIVLLTTQTHLTSGKLALPHVKHSTTRNTTVQYVRLHVWKAFNFHLVHYATWSYEVVIIFGGFFTGWCRLTGPASEGVNRRNRKQTLTISTFSTGYVPRTHAPYLLQYTVSTSNSAQESVRKIYIFLSWPRKNKKSCVRSCLKPSDSWSEKNE